MITASKLDLTRASIQDVFDYVVFALLNQGQAARGPQGCRYRAPDGCKCAAGQLIDDDEYLPWIENRTITEVALGLPSLGEWVSADAVSDRGYFLRELQKAHDQYPETGVSWLENFRACARGVAQAHNLDDSITRYREQAQPAASRPPYSIIGADDEISL